MGNFLQNVFGLFQDNSPQTASETVLQSASPSTSAPFSDTLTLNPTSPVASESMNPEPETLTIDPPAPNSLDQPAQAQAQVKYQWVYNLTIANCLELEAFTYPSLQKRWQTYQPRGPLGGVAASIQGQMVGLVVAELLPQQAEIISFFVAPDSRHHGIGSQLLRLLETGLVKLNCPQVQLSYRLDDLTLLALEPILRRQGWQTPKTNFLITKATIESLQQAPWVYKYPLPPEFTVFPWIEITPAERDRILQRKTYPDTLSPFSTDPRLEPLNSLGLRYQGEVIGWCLTHRVAPDTIRYSTMFVEPKFQKLGRGFSLLAEAVKRHIDSGVPFASASVASNNLAMLHCVERYYKPYALFISESRSSSKSLH